MIKDIFIDVETTGLDPVEHGIIQIAAMIEVDGQIVKTISLDCDTFPDDAINDKALEVNKKTLDQIREYPDPKDVYKIFTDTMGEYVDRYDPKDKFHFIAYNASFDMDFLRAWFTKEGDKYFGSWFHFPPIDVMGLAAQHLKNVRAFMPNFRLGTVAAQLGLSIDDEDALHDAMYDIVLAKQVYYHVINREQSSEGAGNER